MKKKYIFSDMQELKKLNYHIPRLGWYLETYSYKIRKETKKEENMGQRKQWVQFRRAALA